MTTRDDTRKQDTIAVSTLYTASEAEGTVASALLHADPELDSIELLNRFTAQHFASSVTARHIFNAARALYAKDGTFDFISIADYIRHATTDVSASQVRSCMNYYRGAASALAAARVVEETHRRRALVALSERLLVRAPHSESGELALQIRAELDAILDGGKTDAFDLSALAQAISDRVDGGAERTIPRPTGLRRLDWLLNGGFRPGQLVVVGARSSHGKTAFGIGNLASASAGASFRVCVITLEMPPDELAARFLTSASGVPIENIIAANITGDAVRQFARGMADISKFPVKIAAPRDKKLSNLIRVVRTAVRRDGAQIVFIDYLQLIRHDRATMPRYEAVADISGSLKGLAIELGIPVVVLAQLNRQADGEAPRMAHLRESGAIEQDADVVLLLHRPDDENGIPQDLGWVIVDKNRNGKRGRANVAFIGERCAFIPTEDEPREVKRRSK